MKRQPPRSPLFPSTALFRSREMASEELEASTADIELTDGAARVAGTDRVVTFAEIAARVPDADRRTALDRKSTRLNSSHANISYAVFCLKKKQLLHSFLYIP